MTTLTYEPARALEVVALPPRQREVLALHVGGLRYSGSRTRPAAQGARSGATSAADTVPGARERDPKARLGLLLCPTRPSRVGS